MRVQTNEDHAVAPPGEFVSEDLERDCARFLDELRKRTAAAEGFPPQSEK
jgi:hypothetical protein